MDTKNQSQEGRGLASRGWVCGRPVNHATIKTSEQSWSASKNLTESRTYSKWRVQRLANVSRLIGSTVEAQRSNQPMSGRGFLRDVIPRMYIYQADPG